MQIFSSIDSYKGPRPVVSMGTFDGVHPGHRALIEKVKDLAKRENTESVILTFWPHPRIVLNQDVHKLRLLTTLEEKTKIISATGIDNLIIVPFTKELADLTARQFVEELLVKKLNTLHLLMGYNHRFGKGGITFRELIPIAGSFNFGLSQFKHIDVTGLAPSSTAIRNLLMEGKIQEANRMLGYRYTITGRVTGGMKIGRKLMYPTANLEISERAKLIPPDGVYACIVNVIGKTYGGMVNIGLRPTVSRQMDNRTIEIHILDFDRQIYSEEISIGFIVKTREEMKFANLDELRQQLKKDETQIRQILAQYSRE